MMVEETITLTTKDIKVRYTNDVDRYVNMFAGTYRLTMSILFNNVKVLDYDMKDNINVISDLDLELEALDEAISLNEWYVDGGFEIVSFIMNDKLYAIAYDELDEQIVLDVYNKINDNLYVSKRRTPVLQLNKAYYNVYRDDEAEVIIDIDCNDMIIDIGDTIRLITTKSSETRVIMNVYEKIK